MEDITHTPGNYYTSVPLPSSLPPQDGRDAPEIPRVPDAGADIVNAANRSDNTPWVVRWIVSATNHVQKLLDSIKSFLGFATVPEDNAYDAIEYADEKDNITLLNDEGLRHCNLLKGQTIRPDVAEKYMHLLKFDHLGRLTGEVVDGARMSRNDFYALEEAIIPDLSIANSTAPRDAKRTESEVVLQIVSALEKAAKCAPDEKRDILKEHRGIFTALWLGGQMNRANVCAALSKAAKTLSDAAPELASMAETLHAELADRNAETNFTQYNDNFFGRAFETEVVHYLVRNPPAPALAAAGQVGQFLWQYVEKNFGEEKLKWFLLHLATNLSGDKRPWHAETPEVSAFLAAPTRESFKRMMFKTETGFDIIKQHWLLVKTSLAFGINKLPPWMKQANMNYSSVVVPARSSETSPLAPFSINRAGYYVHGNMVSKVTAIANYQPIPLVTRGYGTHLPYQPAPRTPEGWKEGRSVQSAVRVNVHNPTSFERNALINNQYTVNGVSGSTNISTFLFYYMKQLDPNFSISDAFAGTMMFLTFDGGHSITESTGTFSSIAGNGHLISTDQERKERLNKHVTRYNTLASDMFSSKETQEAVAAAVNHGFERTLEKFSDIHTSRLERQML